MLVNTGCPVLSGKIVCGLSLSIRFGEEVPTSVGSLVKINTS